MTVLDPDGSRRRTGQVEGPGLVALVGVTHGDDESTAVTLAEKTAGVRILSGTDAEGNHREEASCLDLDAPVLAVSQFTLYGDCRRGKRPSWSNAAPGPVSEPVVDHYVQHLRSLGLTVEAGEFGADMRVELVNDGPVTLILDSEDLNRPRKG